MTKTTPLGFSVAMLQKFAAKTRTISELFMYPAALLLVFRSPPPWVLPLFFRSPGQQWAMIASVGCQLPMRQISYSTQQETFWILQFLQCFCCHRRSPKCLNLHKITRKTIGPSRLALPMLTPQCLSFLTIVSLTAWNQHNFPARFLAPAIACTAGQAALDASFNFFRGLTSVKPTTSDLRKSVGIHWGPQLCSAAMGVTHLSRHERNSKGKVENHPNALIDKHQAQKTMNTSS